MHERAMRIEPLRRAKEEWLVPADSLQMQVEQASENAASYRLRARRMASFLNNRLDIGRGRHRPRRVTTEGCRRSDRIVHLELDRVRGVLEVVHLLPFQLHVRFEEVAFEDLALGQEGVVVLQFADRLAQ